MKLLMVSVGGGRYAVPADAVARILDPAIESGLRLDGGAGRATWRGRELPVVDLADRSGARPAAPRILLLIEGAGGGVLVPVDAAEAIRDIPADAIAPLPAFIFSRPSRLVRGVFADPGGPRLLLDEGALA